LTGRFTIRVTIVGLCVGVMLTTAIGLTLLTLRQPLTVDDKGNLGWNLGALVVPITAIVAAAILYWSLFQLPRRAARQRGVVLDPEIWPAAGVFALGGLIALGFIVAILAGLI
jgi:predicted membrane protein